MSKHSPLSLLLFVCLLLSCTGTHSCHDVSAPFSPFEASKLSVTSSHSSHRKVTSATDSCDALTFVWRHRLRRLSNRKQLRFWKHHLRKIGRCERWEQLFSGVLLSTPPKHFSPLSWLEEQGVDVEFALQLWLSETTRWHSQSRIPGVHDAGHQHVRSISRLLEWLVHKPHAAAFCQPIQQQARSASAPIRRKLIAFLLEVQCQEMPSFLREQLSHPATANRIQACRGLARMGGKMDLFFLKHMATRDSFWTKQGPRKEYPVRVACQKAYQVLQQKLFP